MSEPIAVQGTMDEELREAVCRGLASWGEQGAMILLLPTVRSGLSIGQAINIATTIPNASTGPLPVNATSFLVLINTPDIELTTTLYARIENNADFQFASGSPATTLTFDPDLVDEPLVLTVQYTGANPIPAGTFVTISWYSDSGFSNLLGNEVVSYDHPVSAIFTPHPRKMTIKKINNTTQIVTLRWRVDKVQSGSYTLNVTYTDPATGGNLANLFRTADGNPAPTTVSSAKKVDVFRLKNVASASTDVLVSVSVPGTPAIKASILLHLTP